MVETGTAPTSRAAQVPAATWEAVAQAARAAMGETHVEAALLHVVDAALACAGDADAHTRPGALKDGETHFFVSGVYLVAGRHGHVLVAERGFPEEQHRMRIPIDIAHPGWVWRNQKPLLLANTDDHQEFKQILKTARMGSVCYAPMMWNTQMVGQLILAAQARHTYSEIDLDVVRVLAALAASVFAAKDGPRFLAGIYRA